jgi:hypothetical protein
MLCIPFLHKASVGPGDCTNHDSNPSLCNPADKQAIVKDHDI